MRPWGVPSDDVASQGAGASRSRRILLAHSDRLCGVSDVGRVRDNNEDVAYVCGDAVMIVADGMGGHEAGEVASALAVEAITAHLKTELVEKADLDTDSIKRTMLDALDAAHQKIIEAGKNQESDKTMGCTLLLACVRDGILYTCHAGDVRGYVSSGQHFRPITRDHSVVATLVDAGQLSADQARTHPLKNEVLQALGMSHGLSPDVNSVPMKRGDRVLLCSDGLWESLADEEIASIVGSDGSMRQIATQLVDRANEAGGRDNITVVLYEHAEALP